MKRTLAVLTSAVLALSVAPFASATTAAAPVASGNLVGVTVAAPIFDRDSRKRCTNMCVQSTLPTQGYASYFVNNNSALLSFYDDGLALINLDTKESFSVPYVDGFSADGLMTAISNDQDEVYFYDTLDSDNSGHVFRVDTLNMWGDAALSIVDVTPESPTYPLSGSYIRGLAVAPDNSGYYYIYRPGTTHRVCQFDENGVEVACSAEFGGSGETSRIFMNYAGDLLFVMGDEDKRFAFDAANELSMFPVVTIARLTGTNVNFEIGTQTVNGDMIFMDRYDPSRTPAETYVYSVHMDGFLIDQVKIKGNFGLQDILAPAGSYSVYALGVGTDRRGNSNTYDSLYEIRANPSSSYNQSALKVRKHLAMSTRREPSMTKLAADNRGRYVVAFADDGVAKVIPVGGVDIYVEATGIDENNDTVITWDFINLFKGVGARRFNIEYKAPGTRKWRNVGIMSVDGTRTFSLGPVANEGKVRVVPVGVKMNDIDNTTLRSGSPG